MFRQKAVVNGSYLARQYLNKEDGGSGGLLINVASMAGEYDTLMWGGVGVFSGGARGRRRGFPKKIIFLPPPPTV